MNNPAPKPLTILVIIGSMNMGGCESDILRIVPRLDRSRFEVSVMAFWQRGSLADDLIATGIQFIPPIAKYGINLLLTPYRSKWAASLRLKALANLFIRLFNITLDYLYLVRLPYYLFTKTMPKYPLDQYCSYILHIQQVINRLQPDIIHCFLPGSYHYGTLCHVLTRNRPQRKLVMSRVSLGFYFQGHPLTQWWETKFCHRMVDRAVGNAKMIIDELRHEGLPAEKLRLIYNGIDVAAFARPPFAKPIDDNAQKVTLSTVANLHEYKGYADLIAALGLLVKANITNWHLNIAGRDVAGAMAKYRALCREVGIADHVTFWGQLSHDHIIAHLHQSQIHLHPSHHEGLPNSILEAMSAELPIIATAVGGIPELVKDGESGLLIPPQQPERLAAAIKHLLQNPDLRLKMGKYGAKLARENFTLDQAVAQFEQLYEGA